MHEVLKSTNLVTISYACHLLDEHEIEYFLFDAQMSAMEGSIGAFPRRLMVIEGDLEEAQCIFIEAGIS